MNIIIIDTCIFLSENDFFFEKPKFKLLRLLKENKIILPEIVLKEIISNIKFKLNSINNKTENDNIKIKNYGLNGKHLIKKIDINNATQELYDNLLTCYKTKNIELFNYSSVSLDSVLQRIFDRERPFKEDGGDKGLKDYLIWETIRNIIHKYSKENIVFITDNKKDFCIESKLHPHFYDDLKKDKLDNIKIEVLKLDEFLNKYKMNDDPDEITNIISGFINGNINIEVDNKLKNIDDFFCDNLFNISDMIGIYSEMFCYQVELDSVGTYELIENSIKYSRFDNELYIEFEIQSNFEASIGGWGGENLGECNLRLLINLTYDTKEEIISSIDIDNVEFVEGFSNDDLYEAEHLYHLNFIKD